MAPISHVSHRRRRRAVRMAGELRAGSAATRPSASPTAATGDPSTSATTTAPRGALLPTAPSRARPSSSSVLESLIVQSRCMTASIGCHGCGGHRDRRRPTVGLAPRALLLLALAPAQHLVALVRPGLGPRLAARERQAQDRALHHSELLMERPGVVGQLVALADLAHLGSDLAVARRGHVGVQVVLDLVAQVAADHVE